MRYLLDTNIVSDLVRNPQSGVERRVFEVAEAQVCTSIIVAAELRYGAAKRRSPHLLAQLGTPIGGNDLLIAAQVHCPRLRYRHRQRAAVCPYRRSSL
jgi:tRNA(fMet)-specific endonuclease VapC